jgi:tellurite resistance protein TerC
MNKSKIPEEAKNSSLETSLPYDLMKKRIKRIFISIAGMTVLIIGILMIVLPGPAIIFIPLGLTILATEYIWARRWLRKLNDKAKELKDMITKKNKK